MRWLQQCIWFQTVWLLSCPYGLTFLPKIFIFLVVSLQLFGGLHYDLVDKKDLGWKPMCSLFAPAKLVVKQIYPKYFCIVYAKSLYQAAHTQKNVAHFPNQGMPTYRKYHDLWVLHCERDTSQKKFQDQSDQGITLEKTDLVSKWTGIQKTTVLLWLSNWSSSQTESRIFRQEEVKIMIFAHHYWITLQ